MTRATSEAVPDFSERASELDLLGGGGGICAVPVPVPNGVLFAELRAAGFSADRAFENRSMKSQMKAAGRRWW